MIHDLSLRAHIVVSGEASEEADKSPKGSDSRKLWPDFALVLDSETTLDLEQRLNFRHLHLPASGYRIRSRPQGYLPSRRVGHHKCSDDSRLQTKTSRGWNCKGRRPRVDRALSRGIY